MGASRRHVLVALLVSSVGALALWLTGRSAPEGGALKEHTPGAAPPRKPTPSGRPSREPGRAPELGQPPPVPAETQPQPSLKEQYPSPYADKPPEEERRLLELTVDHQEKMLSHAEEQLEDLAERADESDEAEDEFESQLQAIREGRAQTEAFKQRLRELNEELR